ncbi:MAG: hypothetical protein ABIU54_08140 [Candidatus Eisenbacteria bacterium]
MSKHFIRTLAGAALLMTLPVLASASTSRLEGMALPGDYTKDFTAIYGWPASVTSVGNLVYGELGNQLVNPTTGTPNGTERAMGAVLPNLWDGRFGVWAIHLRQQTPALGQGDVMTGPNPGQGGNDPNDHQNESFDIMWGRKFGSTSLGLRLNRSFFSSEDETPGVTTLFEADGPGTANTGDPSLARNIIGFGAGLGFDLNTNTTAELSLLYQSRTFEVSTAPTNTYEDDGGTTYMFAGRMMWKCQPNVLVVPVAKFYSFDLSQKIVNGGTTTTYDNSLKGWQAGIAGNWALGSNDLFVLGATVAQNKLDVQNDPFNLNGGILNGFGFSDEFEATETFLPQVFMSLESQVNSWLTLRLGANKGVIHTYKVKDNMTGNNQTLTLKDSPFNMAIGASVKTGALTFDAVLDDNFYNNPIAQLMGGSSANYGWNDTAFNKVSVTYTW